MRGLSFPTHRSPHGNAPLESPPSLQTFALCSQRFSGIELHFKDYKSAAFDLLKSGLRDTQVLARLVMLLDCASLIALMLGFRLVKAEQFAQIDWHGDRGSSFRQLGLRDLAKAQWPAITLTHT